MGVEKPCYELCNETEQLRVWVASGAWGIDAVREGRSYGGVVLWVPPWSWRRKLYCQATAAAQTGWIKSYGKERFK